MRDRWMERPGPPRVACSDVAEANTLPFVPSILLIFGVLALGTMSAAAGATVPGGDLCTLHPQDGPHVDVRLSVEDDEVRVRLEMNLVFLDELIDFPRESAEKVSRLEWVELRPALLSFFREQHPVLIDGARVEPELEKIQINDPDLRLLPLFPVSGERGLRKIRFELVYPVPSPPPTRVSFEWSTFPPNILVDPDDPPPLAIAAELEAEGIRIPLVFTTTERGHTWHASGGEIDDRLLPVPTATAEEGTNVPALAIALFVIGGIVGLWGLLASRSAGSAGPLVIGAVIEGPLLAAGAAALVLGFGGIRVGGGPSLPDADEAEAIFRPLHANVHRAFDFVEEGDIYDALARSVEGEFLDSLYRMIFRGLVMQEEGGAVARITEVLPVSVEVGEIGLVPGDELGERPGFSVRCRWQVEGVVSHWGHAHTRINEYLADWSVVLLDDGWRLAGAEILEQDRIDDGGEDPDHDLFDETMEL